MRASLKKAEITKGFNYCFFCLRKCSMQGYDGAKGCEPCPKFDGWITPESTKNWSMGK